MRRLWFDLTDMGDSFVWQDHGLGLLRTIMVRHGVLSDVVSLRNMSTLADVADIVQGYDLLLMNVRSYHFDSAKQVAQIFKQVNKQARVMVGGMHTLVSLENMAAEPAFDHICVGAGEESIVELTQNPQDYPRIVHMRGARKLSDWPFIDRTVWPVHKISGYPYPLEPAHPAWGPSPMVSMITSRLCPWRCSFCNESSYIPNAERKPVEQVVEELNWLDKLYGPIGSVVFHDSMFFQHPAWLEEWCEIYPKKARKLWPYWAAARPDTLRRWPDLFKRLVKQTHWRTISLGLESGSDRILKIFNKECTVADNLYAILTINQIAREMEQAGKTAPSLFANVIFGAPGETREDVLDTVRMLSFSNKSLVSPAYYAPYPGSALGDQLIAEGKSRMTNHRRDPGGRNVSGVDYAFLDQVLQGACAQEVAATRMAWIRKIIGDKPLAPIASLRKNHMYLFTLKSGKKRISFGTDPTDAIETLRTRLTEYEIQEIAPSMEANRVHPNKLPAIRDQLG